MKPSFYMFLDLMGKDLPNRKESSAMFDHRVKRNPITGDRVRYAQELTGILKAFGNIQILTARVKSV